VIVGFFAYLRKQGKEPSSPKKIGIGMIITSIGFGLMVLASQGLMSPHDLAAYGGVSDTLRSPYWLIGTYFTLTVAELFLSPIGISFVSKVAPPQFKGLAQGGWLGATAIGNLMAGLIGPFWDKWELWQFFLLLVGLTLLSAIFIFSILKLLENATES
jgi:POT family proton-dependent oligopeptide transporter